MSSSAWAGRAYPIDGSLPCGGSWHFESHSYHSVCPSCNNGWHDNTKEPDGKSPSYGRNKAEFRTVRETLEDRYPLGMDEYGVWWLTGRIHAVFMQKRPAYCDRGHYIANIQPADGAGIEYSIDHDDHWPRYYMSHARMLDEIRDWLDWREGEGPKTAGEAVFGGS